MLSRDFFSSKDAHTEYKKEQKDKDMQMEF